MSALVQVLTSEEMDTVLSEAVTPHIEQLIYHPQANFVVQDVIENVHTSNQVSHIILKIR